MLYTISILRTISCYALARVKVYGMLGIDDPWIWGGYLIAIGLVVFCCVYGWIKRNDGDE